MHRIKGEYSDGDCGVGIEGGEPYVILNLEMYHKAKSIGGAHCDFVYITFKNEEFTALVVELKEINDVTKGNLRESLQGKFPQTLKLLKEELMPVFGLSGKKNVGYCAVLVIPEEVTSVVGALIKRDKMLLGELKNFDKAWITACDENVRTPWISLK
ncbi:hypothetical protein A3L11_01965 [Thermococcus siculi]|uniref:Uncharacterized protein n=1 Tax=Thermococcus siculi TaxID=72803 RepID=A0A2Z2MKA8_9EURY|nr:hypothetical protein [Thermococcus siculi]ASJ08055.1 hypothetical protein A3L11_01965 [Thermococcus siculi]